MLRPCAARGFRIVSVSYSVEKKTSPSACRLSRSSCLAPYCLPSVLRCFFLTFALSRHFDSPTCSLPVILPPALSRALASYDVCVVCMPTGLTGPRSACILSDDGQLLASVSAVDHAVEVRDAASGTVVWTFSGAAARSTAQVRSRYDEFIDTYSGRHNSDSRRPT